MTRPTPAVDMPSLQSASRVLEEQLVKDAQAVPELGDMLTIRTLAAANGPVSGLCIPLPQSGHGFVCIL